MTYNRMPDGNYRLAEKLRQEYRNRGQSLHGIRAASTEELVARAQMGYDPRENVSEEAFTDRLRDRNYTYRREQYQQPYRNAPRAGQTPRSTRSQQGQSAAQLRAKAVQASRNARRKAKEEEKRARAEQAASEVIVKSKRLPVGYLTMLVMVTVMIMSILFSIAQIYQTTGTIADLERELSELQTTASELELAIEEKNDIRVIEQIATDQLGMVKEDSVQTKYISLSEGERIDLIADETDTAKGPFGTMLSSLADVFLRFFGGSEE